MKCVACPFNDGLTEEATVGQNLGCLPTAGQMIDLFDQSGVALSCHKKPKTPCRGLCENRTVPKKVKVKSYEDWYHGK